MKGLIFILTLLVAGSANAVLLTSVYGDKDCFGLGGSCSVGDHYVDDLGGAFLGDNRDGSDPAETDIWNVGSESFSLTLDLTGLSLVSAELELFHAGAGTLAIVSPNIFINGSALGDFGGGDNRATLDIYDVLTSDLSDSNTVDITLKSRDGWILDYAELRVNANANVGEVPEPASLALLGLGLVGLGVTRRKKSFRNKRLG